MNSRVKYNVANPMTVEDARNWCMMAYANTMSRGFYVAGKFEGVRARDMMNVAAKRAGVVKLDPKLKKHVWHDIKQMPTGDDAVKVFKAYEQYKDECTANSKARQAKAKAAKKQKAKTLDELITAKKKEVPESVDPEAWAKGESGSVNKGKQLEVRWIRIDDKVNKFPNMWNSK